MKTKLAIFDFDGTLTKSNKGGNCWRYVWEDINAVEVDDKLYKEFKEGRFDSHVWASKVTEEFRKRGVKKSTIQRLSNNINIRDGVEETFAFLKSQGVKIYVLSGGIKSMIEYSLKNSISYITNIEAEDLSYDSNDLVNGVIHLDHDTENKKEFITKIIKKNNLMPEQVFFMGNADNDESAHQAGVKTLCVNPDNTNPYDKNYWDHYIENIQNLKEILPFID